MKLDEEIFNPTCYCKIVSTRLLRDLFALIYDNPFSIWLTIAWLSSSEVVAFESSSNNNSYSCTCSPRRVPRLNSSPSLWGVNCRKLNPDFSDSENAIRARIFGVIPLFAFSDVNCSEDVWDSRILLGRLGGAFIAFQSPKVAVLGACTAFRFIVVQVIGMRNIWA